MSVAETSRLAYYNRLLNGTARKKRDRVMKFIIVKWREGHKDITRHAIAAAFSPRSTNFPKAFFDNDDPIPLQSVCSSVKSLIGNDKSNPDYVRVYGTGPDPITGNTAEYLAPIEKNWAQKRLFND